MPCKNRIKHRNININYINSINQTITQRLFKAKKYIYIYYIYTCTITYRIYIFKLENSGYV